MSKQDEAMEIKPITWFEDAEDEDNDYNFRPEMVSADTPDTPDEDVVDPKDSSAAESADSPSSETPTEPESPQHPVNLAPVEKASGKPKASAPSTPTS